MQYSNLPNTFLINTKPPLQNKEGNINTRSYEWLFVIITEQGRKLIQTLDKSTYTNIKKELKTLWSAEKDLQIYTKYILEFLKNVFWKSTNTKNFSITKNKQFSNSSHTSASYIIEYNKEKFFVKFRHNDRAYNSYNESIGLILWKEIVESLQKKSIDIEVISPLYAVYDKKTDISMIITPYKEWYQQLSEIRRWDGTLNHDSEKKLKNIINIINQKIDQHEFVYINDLTTKQNTLIKKEKDWTIKILLIDPNLWTDPYTIYKKLEKLK